MQASIIRDIPAALMQSEVAHIPLASVRAQQIADPHTQRLANSARLSHRGIRESMAICARL